MTVAKSTTRRDSRSEARMESHTIRVNKKTLAAIRELAEKSDKAMTSIVEEAVREHEIEKYWEDYYADYEAPRASPGAWADFQEELGVWDCTLADGLKDLPYEQDGSASNPSPKRGVNRRSGSPRRS